MTRYAIPIRHANPASDRTVLIHDYPVPFSSIRPLFEQKGLTGFNFDQLSLSGVRSSSGVHWSNYLTGTYQGKPTGVLFGRQAWIYEHEVKGLAKLCNPGIPECYGTGNFQITLQRRTGANHINFAQNDEFGYLLLRHLPGLPLNLALDFSSAAGRKQAVIILTGVVDLLDYVHSRGVVHQDVKAPHVLVDGQQVSLIDFHLWDDVQDRPPTIDFCGLAVFPSIVADELYAGRPRELDKVPEWEPQGYGKMLESILPPDASGAFFDGLRAIAKRLAQKTERYVYSTLSRDLTSRNVRAALQALSVE